MIRTLFLSLLLVAGLAVSADVVEHTVGGRTSVNDTLLFRGVQGNSELNRLLPKDLANCGWFDMVRSGVANYIVSGSASGNTLRLDLLSGAGSRITTITTSGENPETVSKRAVDALLQYLYKNPGICC